jgi:hypothetical protein
VISLAEILPSSCPAFQAELYLCSMHGNRAFEIRTLNLVMSNYCCNLNSPNALKGVQSHGESKGCRIDSGGYYQGCKSLQSEPPDAEVDGLG